MQGDRSTGQASLRNAVEVCISNVGPRDHLARRIVNQILQESSLLRRTARKNDHRSSRWHVILRSNTQLALGSMERPTSASHDIKSRVISQRSSWQEGEVCLCARRWHAILVPCIRGGDIDMLYHFLSMCDSAERNRKKIRGKMARVKSGRRRRKASAKMKQS